MSLLTEPDLEGTIELSPGRRLAFCEFGPVRGRPVVWMHGTPGARRQIPQAARLAAEELDIRLIGIDRPGVGDSTPFLYASLLDFVPDLTLLIDRLGIDRFAMLGLSGGGPYALACAYALPERVVVAGVLGGVAPTQGEDAIGGGVVGHLAPLAPLTAAVHRPLATALGLGIWAMRPVASPVFELYARLSPEGDRAVFSRPEIKAMFLDDLVRGSRRGLAAPLLDFVLFCRPWGFSVREVTVPVRWWHGDADHIVPLAHGEHVVSLLPDAELSIRPGESHLGGLGAAEDVLGTLLVAWDERSPSLRSGEGLDGRAARSPGAPGRTQRTGRPLRQ
ncbi:MAG TPA: alpha/beta hydrolase [Acidimicrobiales bacterium]|nr:alpha/beta hydrolase [Acidimicrobiales bacterium]